MVFSTLKLGLLGLAVTEGVRVKMNSTTGWTQGTYTTGYWDCCKPSCSWPGKGHVNHTPTPAPAPASCTSQDKDPYSTGSEVQCCDGLQKCLGDWSGNGNWNYNCKKSCGSSLLSHKR